MKHLALLVLLAACGSKAKAPAPAPAAADPGCICPMVYQPVCGTDGKTYGNECEATCVKVAVKTKGACS